MFGSRPGKKSGFWSGFNKNDLTKNNIGSNRIYFVLQKCLVATIRRYILMRQCSYTNGLL